MSNKKAIATKILDNEIDFHDVYMREASIEKQNINNLLQRMPSNVADSRSTNQQKVIEMGEVETNEPFDKSVRYEEVFICQYWDSNDIEKKGKLNHVTSTIFLKVH